MSIGRLARSGLVAGIALASSWVATPAPASAHPLGNFTVNRAVIVEVGASSVEVRYVVDMAEIPAFTERRLIDADVDDVISDDEGRAWADATCASARAGLVVGLDGEELSLAEEQAPELAFPPGAGGLDTVRLDCRWSASVQAVVGEHVIEVRDASDDGRPGWREVTIAPGPGIELVATDVPEISPSGELSAYPEDLLQSPPDVRAGSATLRPGGAAVVTADGPGPAAVGRPTDALAGLISGGSLSLGLLGPLVAGLLGAAHAVSPGHGKTLVAAYVIGSRGTLRHAAVLGLTVAATHTVGVFVLGAVLLLGGELIVPEQLITWLSIAAAVLVVGLGLGMLWRALADARHARSHHHGHHHSHGHGHGHDHAAEVPNRLRSVIALGLAGGMVPSASAVIVLVVAIGTNEVLYGLALIGAFGLGMAVVLGGLALTTGWVRGRVAERVSSAGSPVLRRAGRAVPFVAATAVLVAGVATGIGALTQVL